MPLCFGQFGNPIRQKIAERIAGDNKHRQIDLALKEFLTKMNQINGHYIAPARNLNFHADADVARPAVYRLPFHPIHAAALLLNPSAGSAKTVVNDLTKAGGSIRFLTFFDAELKRRDKVANLSQQLVKAEPLNEGVRPVKRLLRSDFGHKSESIDADASDPCAWI